MSAGKVESAEFIRSAHGSGDFLRDGRPELVFVGRSNVGKSSLMNRLLGRKGLARISSTPGRTRSVNYFLVNGRFYFVDLPGYGYAKAGRDQRREWGEVVDLYLQSARPRARVLMLVDGKVGATPLDVEAYGYLHGLGIPVTVVATKIDKIPSGRRQAALDGVRRALSLGAEKVVPASARTGEGIKEIWSEIGLHLEAIRR